MKKGRPWPKSEMEFDSVKITSNYLIYINKLPFRHIKMAGKAVKT